MNSIIVLTLLFATFATILGAIVMWIVSFVHYPVQTTLRVTLSTIALLCGSFVIPKFNGEATLYVNLGPILKLDGDAVTFSSGDPFIDWAVPFATLGMLAAICLFRVRVD